MQSEIDYSIKQYINYSVGMVSADQSAVVNAINAQSRVLIDIGKALEGLAKPTTPNVSDETFNNTRLALHSAIETLSYITTDQSNNVKTIAFKTLEAIDQITPLNLYNFENNTIKNAMGEIIAQRR